jgi:hypothetical protein
MTAWHRHDFPYKQTTWAWQRPKKLPRAKIFFRADEFFSHRKLVYGCLPLFPPAAARVRP